MTSAVGSPGGPDAGEDLADDRLAAPAAEVLQRLLDRDPLGPLAGDPADAPQRVVRPIARGPDDRGHRRRPARGAAGDPLGDVEDRVDPGLVVGEVDDHDPRPEPEQVQPARRALRRRLEIGQSVAQLGERDAEPARGAGRGEGVRDVVAGEPAEGDRDAVDLDDLVLDRLRPTARAAAVVPVAIRPGATSCSEAWLPSISTSQPSRSDVAAPARRDRPPDRREAPRLPDREHRDVRPQPPGDRRDERIVARSGRPSRRAASPGRPSTSTSASSGSVWIPWRSRWSDVTFVITLASFDS